MLRLVDVEMGRLGEAYKSGHIAHPRCKGVN